MARIDCETRESALHTLAYFYNLTPLEVDQFLLATDISEIHESSLQFCYFDEALRGIFNQEFGEPVISIDEVCWFHLTRTRSDSTFQAGILSLGSAIKEIWNTLLEIFEGTKHYDNLLQLKDCGVAESPLQSEGIRSLSLGTICNAN